MPVAAVCPANPGRPWCQVCTGQQAEVAARPEGYAVWGGEVQGERFCCHTAVCGRVTEIGFAAFAILLIKKIGQVSNLLVTSPFRMFVKRQQKRYMEKCAASATRVKKVLQVCICWWCRNIK